MSDIQSDVDNYQCHVTLILFMIYRSNNLCVSHSVVHVHIVLADSNNENLNGKDVKVVNDNC